MEQPIEVSAKTVEEAIDLALRQLGAKRDEVEVEVLSRGKPGFLGFGAELARVRLIRSSALDREEPQRPTQRLRAVPPPPPRTATPSPRAAAPTSRVVAPPPPPRAVAPPPPPAPVRAPAPIREVPATSPADLAAAQKVVDRLLELMQVKAQSSLGPPPQESPGTPVIQVTGEDAGLLIGRGGETLRALQLLTNLLRGQDTPGGGPVIIDVEHYRERRGEALRRLAQRIADRVVASGRPFILEPMPAYERRLIHIALADDPRVATESVGEGEERKVSVHLRQETTPARPPRPLPARPRPSAAPTYQPPSGLTSGADQQPGGNGT